MKRKYAFRDAILNSCLIVLMSAIYFSCDEYNFSGPLPTDQPDLSEFPIEFSGKWYENDTAEFEFNETIQLESMQGIGGMQDDPPEKLSGIFSDLKMNQRQYRNDSSETLFIGKDYFYIIWNMNKKVFNGLYPDGKLLYEFGIFDGLRKVVYDSVSKKTDTVDNFIFRDGLIYEKDPNIFLSKGYQYAIEHDTIQIFQVDTLYVDLGHNAILRKLEKNLYAINLHNCVLGEEGPWWTILIIEFKNGKMYNYNCNTNTRRLPSMFYAKPSKQDVFFFNSQWTKNEMLRLFREGYYSVLNQYERRNVK